VMWCCEALCPGSATAKPANSITTSEGIGMQALEIAIRAKIPGSPASRTKCDVSLTSVSEIEASSIDGQRYPAIGRPVLEPCFKKIGTVSERYRPAGDANLDRPHEQPARARHAPGDRAPASGRPRRARDRARLRPDDRAVRAPTDRAHPDRPSPWRAPRGEARRPRVALDPARSPGGGPWGAGR